MARIIKADEPFERIEEPREQALEFCRELGQEFKVEHIQEGLADQATLSFYRQGEFIDLCRGPHIPSAGAIGAFKLLSVAGAYWKGDQSQAQLQRLYGTAWFSKPGSGQLSADAIEEAKRRDHRVLGKQLELFATEPLVGAGLILWLPKGAMIRGVLENFIKDELTRRGYQPVYTPNIARVDLYKISGHYPYYADSQFKPIVMSEDEQYLLKPMNCPHHIMIYKIEAAQLSRPAGAAGRVRHGVSLRAVGRAGRHDPRPRLHAGRCPHVLHRRAGGRRVPRLHRLDADRARRAGPDATIACGSASAIRTAINMSAAPRAWNKAEAAIERVAREMNLPGCTPEIGEAAFYGPKVDFVVADCLGREWQLGTVQLDYNLPSAERFALEYIGADNQPHRPVMIHRAPLGSLERFVGVLIEHFAGAFPLWLAPEQVRVLIVSEKAEELRPRGREPSCARPGFRVTGDYRPEKIGSKIRDAQLELIPYMFVIGPERSAGRDRGGPRPDRRRFGADGASPRPIDKLLAEVRSKQVRQAVKSAVSLVDRGSANEY